MNKINKKILTFALLCAVGSITSVIASASSVKYNTSSSMRLVSVGNDTASAYTLRVNTQPSSGRGGAYVSIKKSNGTVVTSKTFPFYTTVSDLTSSVPSGSIRRIYIKPATSGQTIIGTLYYN